MMQTPGQYVKTDKVFPLTSFTIHLTPYDAISGVTVTTKIHKQ
jgi:hypothetical protein